MNGKKEDNLYKTFLKQETLCVLATASKAGKPEAATIEFAVDEDENIYFSTQSSYRKYKNIKENPYGFIVITKPPHTLQIQGGVRILQGKEAESAVDIICSKYGHSPKIYAKPEWKLCKFTPTEMQISEAPKWPTQYYDPRKLL